MQDIGVWGWRTTIKSVTRGIGQHCGVVDVLFILLAFSSPPSNKRMPAHRWSWISTVSGHFAFLFDSSESIRLVVFAKPTVWLYNRLMPNQSIASMPPDSLSTPLSSKSIIHRWCGIARKKRHTRWYAQSKVDTFLKRNISNSILSSSKSILFTRV